MEKFPVAHQLLRTESRDLQVSLVEPAEERDVLRVHGEDYAARIRGGTLSEEELYCLGLPWQPALYRRCRLEVAGTMEAARTALREGCAANLAGGTHHAFPDRGLGYCVLNDVAVAIRALHAEEPELRVAVIDTDAHQGNGTHFIFRDDPRVFTYSIHVGKNYPSQKEPGDCDVELPRWVDGREYLRALIDTLPPALAAFRPQLAIWISGADNHAGDRFGQMALTTADMAERDRFVCELCRRQALPLAALYGGGYNRTPGLTARLHAQSVQIAAETFRAI